MSGTPWGIWLIRSGISLLATAALAWGISFKVADYVVKANTSSANEAMHSLQQSLDLLNQSVIASTEATNRLEAQMSELLVRSEQHTASLSLLEDKLGKVSTAVQDAGIDIRVGMQTGGKVYSAEDFKAIFGAEEGVPVYLQLGGPVTDSQ